MLFAEYERCHYANPPLIETICQLRFPTILSIGTQEPAGFQEAIRRDFPRYSVRQETPPPKAAQGPNAGTAQGKPIANYSFISADGRWKLNLTQGFIALSTLSYQGWEEFAARLDKALACFIQIYQPAFFERIGLRYVNAFSRRRLGRENLLWDDLIQSHCLGILGEPDVDETAVNKCVLDVESALEGGCRMKLHTGLGLLGGGKVDKEVKFILDGDFSAAGDLAADSAPARLEELHRYAVRLFRGAITKEAHEAMEPLDT